MTSQPRDKTCDNKKRHTSEFGIDLYCIVDYSTLIIIIRVELDDINQLNNCNRFMTGPGGEVPSTKSNKIRPELIAIMFEKNLYLILSNS